MLTGFNTNVPFRGKVYHVQSEDSGEKAAVVTTLVYFQGTILSRQSFNYTDMLEQEDWKEQVSQRMKKQHMQMIREVLQARYEPAEEEAGADSA